MNQFLIILRGAPSSGKSSMAKALRNYKKRVVWLKVDNFKPFFGDDPSNDALEDVNKAATDSLKYFINNSFSIVMEGVFQNPNHIKTAVKLAKDRNILVKVYELKCSLSTLQERDKVREGVKEGCRKPLGDETIEKIFNRLGETKFTDSIMLDTERMSLEQCLQVIRENLS